MLFFGDYNFLFWLFDICNSVKHWQWAAGLCWAVDHCWHCGTDQWVEWKFQTVTASPVPDLCNTWTVQHPKNLPRNSWCWFFKYSHSNTWASCFGVSVLLFGSLKSLSLLTSHTASHLLLAIFRGYQSGCYVITSLRSMWPGKPLCSSCPHLYILLASGIIQQFYNCFCHQLYYYFSE